MRIGEYIKSVRKSRGLSREDLSDICSVKTLYRTENSITQPSNDLLKKLSRRLSVDFLSFNATETTKPQELSPELVKKIKMLDIDYKFDELYKLSADLMEKQPITSEIDRQFLSYYYVKSMYYVTKNADNAIQFIKDAFNYESGMDLKLKEIHTYLSKMELKVLLLGSAILVNCRRFNDCLALLKDFDICDIDINDYSLEQGQDFLKLTYNKALSLYYKDRKDELEPIIINAIEVCERFSLFDRLMRFYWLYAHYYFDMGDTKNCHKYCEMYLKITEIKKIDHMVEKYKEVFKEKFNYTHS